MTEASSGAERHRYFEELAVTHVVGGLSEADGAVFRAHLLECSECRARVGELRRIAHDLADVERDERRVRAAKAVETKRRETEDDDAELDEPTTNPRTSRVVFLLGLVFVIGLAGWNFMLRANLATQGMAIDRAEAAAQLLIDGRRADVTFPTGEFRAPSQVRYDGEDVVVVLDGVSEGEQLLAYQVGDDQVIEGPYAWTVEGGGQRLTRAFPRALGTNEVIVTRPPDGGGAPPDRVVGQRVLVARLAQE